MSENPLIRRVPKPSELLEKVAQAKAEHKNTIRFLVPYDRKYGLLRKTIWGGTLARVVNRSDPKVLTVELHVATVLAAHRRQIAEEKAREERPLAFNKLDGKTKFDSRR
jgi:hypothetical protein